MKIISATFLNTINLKYRDSVLWFLLSRSKGSPLHRLLIAAPLLFSLFTACVHPSKRERVVTVTIAPQKALAEAICDTLYEVRCMVPQGSSPESYDPTPADLMALNRSSGYFRIGYIGFELGWMDRIARNNPGMKLFDNSVGVDLIEGGHVCADPSHHHPCTFDPHIWTSPRQLRTVARNMADAFCQLDPGHEAFYRANLALLMQRIDRCDSTVASISDSIKHRTFAIYHPSLGYLARDYELEQISLEHEGKEPSAAHLMQLQQQMRTKEVKVVFVQQEFDRKNAELLARENGCRLVGIHPLNPDWESEIVNTVLELKIEH